VCAYIGLSSCHKDEINYIINCYCCGQHGGNCTCPIDDDEFELWEIYVDGKKLPIDHKDYNFDMARHYFKDDKYFDFTVYNIEKFKLNPKYEKLRITFDLDNINDLEVGSKINEFENFSIKLGDKNEDIFDTSYETGDIVVRLHDKKNQILIFGFRNVIINNLDKTKFQQPVVHTITGSIRFIYEIKGFKND
jgi:hypothetical protein